jgi:hypothetical protein
MRGPTTYPSKNTLVTRYEISLETSNAAAIENEAAVGAEVAKVLKSSISFRFQVSARGPSTHTLTVITEQMMVMNHLYLRDQF